MKNLTLKEIKVAYQTKLLTKQQYKTLKGQCLSGEAEAARKGFLKIMKRNESKIS